LDQAAGHDLGLLNPAMYGRGDERRAGNGGLTDVTHGNTTVTFINPSTDPYPGQHTVSGFQAVRGYDEATGLGRPDGAALVSQLGNRHGSGRR
jgi:hypothetical protein